MTVCNMSIEAGARAGMVAPDDTTFAYLEGRPAAPKGADWERALERWRALPLATPARRSTARSRSTSAELAPQVTWGTNPGMVVPVDGRVPDPADFDDPDERAAAERALDVHGPRAGNADPGHPRRPRLHRLVHERADRGPARGRGASSPASASTRASARMVVPGSAQVKRQAEAEGLDRDLQRRRLRVARGRLLDVPGHEPGHPRARASAAPRPRTATSRAGRAAGGRTHLVSPADGRGRRDRRPLRRRPRARARGAGGVKPFVRDDGPASRCSTAPTSTPTRSSRSSS